MKKCLRNNPKALLPKLGPMALHTHKIDGETYAFSWSPTQTLLDALLQADLPARYSCMEGHCGTCQCTLTGGPSHMLNNEVLSNYEIVSENQVLACQTIRDADGPYHCSFDD